MHVSHDAVMDGVLLGVAVITYLFHTGKEKADFPDPQCRGRLGLCTGRGRTRDHAAWSLLMYILSPSAIPSALREFAKAWLGLALVSAYSYLGGR